MSYRDWELETYGLEGKGCHYNFYTTIIDLRLVPGFPVTDNLTIEFINAWCSIYDIPRRGGKL